MYSNHPLKNLLLVHLSKASLEMLSPCLEYVEMPSGQIIANQGELLEHAYFPDTSIVSIIAASAEDQVVEIGTIGKEGCSGINLALGVDRSDRKRLVQIGGMGWKITRELFKEALSKNEEMRLLMYRFILTLLHQTAQTALCNRLHTIEQRCARWLLTTQDRIEKDTVDLNQDFIARMLGVRRAGVNISLHTLQQARLVKLARGLITITDRHGLEEASCACQKETKDYYFETMGFSMSSNYR